MARKIITVALGLVFVLVLLMVAFGQYQMHNSNVERQDLVTSQLGSAFGLAKDDEAAKNKIIDIQVTTGEKVGHQNFYLVKLVDGTRCAVISNPRSGGIDCDWAQKKAKQD